MIIQAIQTAPNQEWFNLMSDIEIRGYVALNTFSCETCTYVEWRECTSFENEQLNPKREIASEIGSDKSTI